MLFINFLDLFNYRVLVNSLFFIMSHFIFFSEDSFPRLGSMIVDYENPLKKIAEQFVPHQQVWLFLCSFLYSWHLAFSLGDNKIVTSVGSLVFNHLGIMQRDPLQQFKVAMVMVRVLEPLLNLD